jgi:hypothetical protein
MGSDDLSKSEFYARRHMIELCKSIADECGDILDQEFEDETDNN